MQWPFRITSKWEDARGHLLLSFPIGYGRRFGLIILEPFVGGWDQQIFIGCFRNGENHG